MNDERTAEEILNAQSSIEGVATARARLTGVEERSEVEQHLVRLRTYAVTHPCVFDVDFPRVFAEGKNRMLFDHTPSRLVSIALTVGADESFTKLFWHASVALLNTATGQPVSSEFLTRKQRRMLKNVRRVVIRSVSELAAAGAFTDEYVVSKAYHAVIDLSPAEVEEVKPHMTPEQLAKMNWRNQ